LSDFQLAYAYSSFLEERSAWKAVIHLNLIRSVNAILDVLSKEMPRTTSQPQSPLNTPRNRSLSRPSTVRVRSSLSITQPSSTPPSAIHVRPSTSAGSRTSQPSEATLVEPNNDPDADDDPEDDDDDEIDSSAPPLTDRHRMLQLRLAPLRQIQRDLERSLGAASTEAPEFAGEAAPWTRLDDVLGTRGTREFSITSRSGWKKALKRVKAGYSSGRRTSLGSRDEARYDDEGECEPQAQSAAEVIASCAEDVAALWSDAGVQAVLSRRKAKARLEEGPGFFLNDVARIAARGYEPSDEDVVRARLRTMGVQEYRFRFERAIPGPDAGRDWLLYDVGGARSLRHAWLPYFDDINALIFLAPISCFDERLAEDRRVNRLQDSILLWKAVCGSKLLQNVQLILFLNKCDLLHKKLSRGVHVAKFVPSYGDKPNDVREVAKYFRHQFKDIFTRYSPEKRPFYAYMTSVT
ncbi:candidate G-protein alpha subunit, partial [Postia placenta Mad-698-R]